MNVLYARGRPHPYDAGGDRASQKMERDTAPRSISATEFARGEIDEDMNIGEPHLPRYCLLYGLPDGFPYIAALSLKTVRGW